MKSPYTGKEMDKVYEKRTWKFRGEEYEYVHAAWLCADSGEMFTTDEMDDAGYVQVVNQYRAKYGIPFTDEIIDVRKKYGVSAAKMSQILGIGVNQWRLYEGGEVPNLSNGRMIRAIMNPNVFLEYVRASKPLLGESEYGKLESSISSVVDESKKNEWDRYVSQKIFLSDRGAENGYGRQSLEHLKHVLLYIIGRCGEVFCTKMNKLLFYSDFVAYRRYGMAITGLTYKALEYGPVPERWDRIYSMFDEVVLEPRLSGVKEGVVLFSEKVLDAGVLTANEQNVLDEVCSRFADMSSTDMSRISHCEDAWLECHKDHGRISYDYAFQLKAI